MLSWEGASRHPPWQSGVWHAERRYTRPRVRRFAEPGRPPRAGGHASLVRRAGQPRIRFLAADDLLDRTKATRLRRALEENLADSSRRSRSRSRPTASGACAHDYGEHLPKTSRARTIYFESRREPGYKAAERLGLVRMMRSQSFRAFAEALAGRKLASGWGLQVLRYGPGDYAGPHNDHHPENKDAKGGYIDLHLSLCLARRRPPVAGLQPRRPFQRDRLGGQARGRDGLPPAVLALHHAAGRHAARPRAGCCWGRSSIASSACICRFSRFLLNFLP